MSWKVGWDDGILQNDDVIAPVCRRRLDPHSLVQLQATRFQMESKRKR